MNETEPDGDDWYLREWMSHFGKRQSDLIKELGWDKAKANYIWHSRQQYRREDVNAVVKWLGIGQHELFQKPTQALALRRLRETAEQIVADASDSGEQTPPRGARVETATARGRKGA